MNPLITGVVFFVAVLIALALWLGYKVGFLDGYDQAAKQQIGLNPYKGRR